MAKMRYGPRGGFHLVQGEDDAEAWSRVNPAKPYGCPVPSCDTRFANARTMRTHLVGQPPYGHLYLDDEAEAAINAAEELLPTASSPAATTAASPAGQSKPYVCSDCGRCCTDGARLRTHLKGRRPKGHKYTEAEARGAVERIDAELNRAPGSR